MARIIRLLLALFLLFVLPHQSLAQTSRSQKAQDLHEFIEVTSELEFQLALEDHVNKLFLNYGIEKVPQEYFLIGLMRLINREYSRRLENPDKARENYFSELQNMLDEIHILKQRLRNAGIVELRRFVSDLETRIKATVDASEINFKKKKVFEDALQMLYVAEEMIKLDQLQQPEQTFSLNQKITESKKDLLDAFGEVTSGSPEAGGASVTIYDLFEEWKELDQKKYDLRLADVKLIRQNLIKASGMDGILRMLNDELKMAYDYFNDDRYDLAERLLADVIRTYPKWGVKNLDDVYYYRAECNFALGRFLHAQSMFEELLQTYPTTAFLPQLYSRLVQLNYALENYANTIDYAKLYQTVSTSSDADYFDVQFLAAMANYQTGEFGEAIDLLITIPQEHPYYRISLYFRANAFAQSQRYDEAIEVYLQLVEDEDTLPSLYYQALYKIGIIEFERQNYFATIEYLLQVPETFARYDKVLNALAWSYYEYEQSKPAGEAQNYTWTKYYANRLLDEFYASPYQMEARSLLAYISQLENRPSTAMSLYRNVYQTKATKQKVSEYLNERERFNEMYREAKELKMMAFENADKEKYLRAVDLVDELETEMMRMDLAEISGVGVGTYKELNLLVGHLEELRRLRQIADMRDDFSTIRRIDSLQVNLVDALERFPTHLLKNARMTNLFDEYPVSKLVAEQERRSERYSENRLKIREEMETIEARLSDLEERVRQAKSNNDYGKAAELELQQDKLQELLKENDNLLSSTYLVEPSMDAYPEFNKWGDFGGFGIINVQFYQKEQTEDDLAEVALTFDKVNKRIAKRKQIIENKIKRIEAEVRFMTMKARMEERTRLRAERERAFREGYFDTRTSESEQE